MRTLQLITQSRGGPVDHAVALAVELAHLGHDSHLAGPRGEHAAAAARAGVAVHDVDVRTKLDLAGARALSGVVDKIRPDVVHLQDRRAGLVGRAVSLRRRVPTAYTLHGVPDPLATLVPGNAMLRQATRRDRWDNLVAEGLLARTPRSVVVTPCEALATYARTHVGIRPDRVHAVHNGVESRWFEAGPVASDVLRPGRVTAVWLGVMAPVKRVPELVAAAAAVPNLDLLLVGDGPERGRIETAIRSADAEDRIRLLGFRSDPAPVLRAADFLVLPSAAEACPMAIIQAMSIGLPIVASRAGGIPEIVRDGKDGLLVDTAADRQLVDALAQVTADSGLRARLGESARTRAAADFTVRRCAERLLDIYAGVAR